jgi:DNA-binding MarR family transcriptional regulator
LYDQDGQRASDLARAISRPPTSFTPILDKIEAKGLIERRASTSDRRSVHIHLTEAGKRLSQPVQKTADRIEIRLRSAIPDERWTEFASLLLALQQPVRDQR